MKALKIGFIVSLVVSLCSFAYYNNKEKNRAVLYQEFLEQFQKVEIPGKLILKPNSGDYDLGSSIKDKKAAEKISNPVLDVTFKDFIPALGRGRMSRLGPSTYRAEALLASNDKFDAIIFSIARPFDRNACSYRIKTFDKKGNTLGEYALGYANENHKVVVAVTQDLHLTIKESQRRKVSLDTRKMQITEEGEIIVEAKKEAEKLIIEERLPVLQKKAPQKA